MNYFYFKVIGSVDPRILDHLFRTLPFSIPCKVLAGGDYPLYAFVPERDQYHARKIIESLSQEVPADCEKLVGVTDIDLCTPVLTFVFGEARLGGTIALVSLRRLKPEYYSLPPDPALVVERLSKVCIHEIGHCFGMVHCNDSKCVMHLSSTIAGVDEKKEKFCQKCSGFLERIIRKE